MKKEVTKQCVQYDAFVMRILFTYLKTGRYRFKIHRDYPPPPIYMNA